MGEKKKDDGEKQTENCEIEELDLEQLEAVAGGAKGTKCPAEDDDEDNVEGQQNLNNLADDTWMYT